MPIDLQQLSAALGAVQQNKDIPAMNIELKRAESVLGRQASMADIEKMRADAKAQYDKAIKDQTTNQSKDGDGEKKKSKKPEKKAEDWAAVASAVDAGDFTLAKSQLPKSASEGDAETIYNILYQAAEADEADFFEEVMRVTKIKPDEETVTVAIESGQTGIIDVLKAFGYLNLDGLGLAVAVNAGQDEIAMQMINDPSGYDIEPEGGGNLALRLAAEKGRDKMVKALLSNPDVVGDIVDAIDVLVDEGNDKAVAMLVSNDAVVDHFMKDKTADATSVKQKLKDTMSSNPDVKTFINEVGGVNETFGFNEFVGRLDS